MATNITHNFISPLPDGPDPNQVQPSEWNDDHAFSIDHADLTNVTANQHHAQDHVIADASALGSHHTTSGLTAGFVLRATAAAAAKFMQLLHADLGSVGADDHHAQDHVLADASALGPHHTTSGLTAGFVLRAVTGTTAKFMQLVHADLGSVGANDHHNEDHATRHSNGGADEITTENLGTADTDVTHCLIPDGSGGVQFAPVPGGITNPPVYIYKSSNEIVNNSSTLQDDNHLFYALAANKSYAFRLFFAYNSDATRDLKIGFTVPTGCTGWAHSSCANAAGTLSIYHGPLSAFVGLSYQGQTSDSAGYIEGTIVNGSTAGTFHFQWAQNTAGSVNSTVFAGSYLIIEPLN